MDTSLNLRDIPNQFVNEKTLFLSPTSQYEIVDFILISSYFLSVIPEQIRSVQKNSIIVNYKQQTTFFLGIIFESLKNAQEIG